MKITFILANNHAARMDVIHANFSSTPPKRSVTIDLTPEQIEKIGIKKIGTNYGKDVYEEIHDVFVESKSE